MSESKILQLVQAVGWSAMYLQEPIDGEGPLYSIPLACWALVEDDRGRSVVKGMCGWDCVDFADAVDSFYGYLGPGLNLRDYQDGARGEYERRQRRPGDRARVQ